jgi:hypothetical protein
MSSYVAFTAVLILVHVELHVFFFFFLFDYRGGSKKMRRMEYEFQTTFLLEKNSFFFLSILKGYVLHFRENET